MGYIKNLILRIKNLFKNLGLIGIIEITVKAICFILFIIGISALTNKYLFKQKEHSNNIDHYVSIMQDESTLSYNYYKYELVENVQKYIDSIAPANNLNAIVLVNSCEKYDIDIRFVLAQAQIESHFGTTGIAKKTNNVFNVGAYDGKASDQIHKKFKYDHPDYSIEPYLKLLFKNYITENGNELLLLNKYVNKQGKRYASNPNYETQLRITYKNITNNTSIGYLQDEMNKYKLIIGC